jgi:hypothetical protein
VSCRARSALMTPGVADGWLRRQSPASGGHAGETGTTSHGMV